MLSSIRSGLWVNETRAVRIAAIFIVCGILATVSIIATSSGGLDQLGRPLGTDFSNVYSAGQMIWEGRSAETYIPIEQEKTQQELFDSPEVPFYAWHYPPFFLLLAALLALLPYTLGWLAWMALTLPLYLGAVRRILPTHGALIVALGFPAVTINFLHGQNGFLTATLITGALLALRSRPIAAGLMIALLAYKPQFGVLIPLALLAGGHYRTFASAAMMLGIMCLTATLVFGVEIWSAFYESRHFSRGHILEAGSTGWERIQSLFSAVRMWGGSVTHAYAAQALLSIGLIASTIVIWRSQLDHDLKAASLIMSSLLITPYMLDYDMVAVLPALLLTVRFSQKTGFLPYERVLLASVWIAPILARPSVEFLSVPVGFLSMLSLYLLILVKAALAQRTRVLPA